MLAAWVATLLLLAGVLLPGSWLPVPENVGASSIPHLDKLAHFGLFAFFSACWAGAVPASLAGRLSVLVAGLALAVGTEWAQGLPAIGRDSDSLDSLADSLGAVAGLGLAALLSRVTSPDGAWAVDSDQFHLYQAEADVDVAGDGPPLKVTGVIYPVPVRKPPDLALLFEQLRHHLSDDHGLMVTSIRLSSLIRIGSYAGGSALLERDRAVVDPRDAPFGGIYLPPGSRRLQRRLVEVLQRALDEARA